MAEPAGENLGRGTSSGRGPRTARSSALLGLALASAAWPIMAWRPSEPGARPVRYLGSADQQRVEEFLSGPGTSPLEGMDPGAVARYLAPWSRQGEIDRRARVLDLLASLDDEAAFGVLVEALVATGAPDRDARLERLAVHHRPTLVLRLVRYLDPSQPASYRVNAALALATLRAAEASGALGLWLADREETPFFRRSCLAALRGMGCLPGLAILVMLAQDPDEILSQTALDLLLQRHPGSPEAVRLLANRRRGTGIGPRETIESLVADAARSHGMDPRLVSAVIRIESDFERRALSSSGAQGLMQLMPETARDLGVTDPFDPRQNIRGGSLYLRRMLDRFRDLPLALAAYNAGPGAVEGYRGIPPYPETVRYVQKVLGEYRRLGGPEVAIPAPATGPRRRS